MLQPTLPPMLHQTLHQTLNNQDARPSRESHRAAHECMLDDMQVVTKSPEGRRTFRRILELCDVGGLVAGTESAMQYREGQRSLGRWLENAIIERNGRMALAQIYEEFI